MKCIKCDAEFKGGEEFCGECGAPRQGNQKKKGGLGIIFVGLGVLLLIIILIVGMSEDPTPISPPTSPEIKQTITRTTINQVTSDYLIGDWSKSDKSFSLRFNPDGTIILADTSTSYSGIYSLTDSKILLTLDDGSKQSYALSYIDPNTFKMGDAVYGRTITEPTIDQVTSDYLIGDWSKSDNSFALRFNPDGTFILADTSTYYSGRFILTDSKILLTFDDGSTQSYALSYLDQNTFKMGDAVYGRI